MGQGGNVWEWNESAFDGSNNTAGENRELRGGAWSRSSSTLVASGRTGIDPVDGSPTYGFRVASVPEPSALSLFAIGLGILFRRSRKRD